MFSTFVKLAYVFVGTFLEQKTLDLGKFMFFPDWRCNELNILIIVLVFYRLSHENKIRSSTNRRCETGSLDLLILTSVSSPLTVAQSIMWVNDCIQIMKIQGERGSPWHMPLDGSKTIVGLPFIMMEMEAEEIQFMIRFIRLAGKPKLWRDLRMNDHSSLSKVFTRSILSIMLSVRPDMCWKEWIAS